MFGQNGAQTANEKDKIENNGCFYRRNHSADNYRGVSGCIYKYTYWRRRSSAIIYNSVDSYFINYFNYDGGVGRHTVNFAA